MAFEHLDTLIAFAGVMAGVSLMVTVLVQGANAILGLRGLNLWTGLQTLLHQTVPGLPSPEAARLLAEEVLSHPLVSDSAFARRDSIFLAFLRWTRADRLGWIRSILGRWRLASTIRVEELCSVLRRLVEGLPTASEEIAQLRRDIAALRVACKEDRLDAAKPLLESLTQRLIQSGPRWSRMLTEADAGLDALDRHLALAQALLRWDDEATQQTTAIAAKIKDAVGGVTGSEVLPTLQQVFPHLADQARRAGGELREWFDSTMDRTSQSFIMHTRIWTAVFSVLLAVALQLDAVALLRRLSSDAELRSRLVGGAEALRAKADDLLAGEILAEASERPPGRAYNLALDLLIQRHAKALPILTNAPIFTNLRSATNWLALRLQVTNAALATNLQPAEAWVREYTQLVPQASLRAAADRLNALLEDDLTLAILPDPYPGSLVEFVNRLWSHLPGILVSAALLSLGAPFWFNLLKSLSNLRPVVAQKQERETQGRG